MTSSHALRGTTLSFRDNPFLAPPSECLNVTEDALILIEDGIIKAAGSWQELSPDLPAGTPVTHYPDALISAGFIDTHVHYPQISVIASYGEQLLEWLTRYVFPAEAAFADPAVATEAAGRFLHELLRAGTTTAAVYCTVHPQSADAFFTEAQKLGLRMIAGKVLMDRNAPEALRDTVRTGYDQSADLIAKWHGKDRLSYAVTPRFAITSTPEQLEAAGDLLDSAPGLFLQTHLAENREEVRAVAELFPKSRSYLDVYDRAGLVRRRSVFGHAIHIDEPDLCRCHETGAALSHCPTSNLFLGSGAFRLSDAVAAARPVHVGLGTDVGAGTSLSLLSTMGEAYKVALIGGHRLHPVQALWLATRGGAAALGLEDRIGSIAVGMEADLCVLDGGTDDFLRWRLERCDTVQDQLFVLMTLGDARCVRATWAGGRRVYERPESPPGP
ncbi:guanine deaminase [Acetobacter sp. AN02]|uniref:guanine deaminase n=1 Tax=Acetobacter sp. AN02 TaxID=2894186 RepID=UPI0024342426|nr:guanine deaminase [Acetobacter sp. AN02]MDG6093850.1 guanine deaminase [Acetobacter sp. AN02]